jgi:hypothetical protein
MVDRLTMSACPEPFDSLILSLSSDVAQDDPELVVPRLRSGRP